MAQANTWLKDLNKKILEIHHRLESWKVYNDLNPLAQAAKRLIPLRQKIK